MKALEYEIQRLQVIITQLSHRLDEVRIQRDKLGIALKKMVCDFDSEYPAETRDARGVLAEIYNEKSREK